MNTLLRAINISMVALFLTMPLAQTSYAATSTSAISDVILIPPTVKLFGHVTIVDGYASSNFAIGCYAVFELRDKPGKTIAVRTSDQSLQSLLVAALTTGNLVSVVGQNASISPPPRGGAWIMDVYNIDEVTLYNTK